MDSVTTILKYGNERHCLIVLVESYQGSFGRTSRTSRDEVIVYEADLASGQKAFLSVLGKGVELRSGDCIQINKWYASKLGLQEGEPLPLRRIKSTVPTAERISVEPLTPDDWEILEKNAGRVEAVLLDQVRVVWPGQVLPVWIQQSIFVYLKVREVEPAVSCVILENNTEVVVAPKVRDSQPPSSLPVSSRSSLQYQSSSPAQNRTEQLTSSSEYDNMDILEPKPAIRSPMKSPRTSIRRFGAPRLKSLNYSSNASVEKGPIFRPMVQRQSSLMESVMKYIFPFRGEKKDVPDNLSDSDKGSVMDFSTQDLPSRNGVLRVQPMALSCKLEDYFSFSKKDVNRQIMSMFSFRSTVQKPSFEQKLDEHKTYNIPLEVFQPSTVYVDAEHTRSERLVHPYLPRLPNNFIAKLQRLPSPQEKSAAAMKDGRKMKVSGTTAELTQIEATESVDNVTSGAGSGNPTNINASCYVRVVAIDRKAGLTDDVWQKAADQVLSNQPLLHGHVIIPDLLRRQLRLEATGSVWIQTGPVDLVLPHKVHINLLTPVPSIVGNDMLIVAFRNYIKLCANQDHPLVVFQGIFLKFMVFPDLFVEIQLTFFGENDLSNVKAVTMLSELNIDSVQIVVVRDAREDKLGVINQMLVYCQITDLDAAPFPQKLKQLGGVDVLAQQALLYLHASLASRPLSRCCFQIRGGLSHGILLITGPKGSGKSSLVKGLCRKMAHLPIFAHITLIDCKALRGKTVSMIQKILEMAFDEAAWREPAVIVLESLDVIVPAPSGPETELTGESLYSAKNVQVLEGLIRYEIENNSRVTVIATSTSRSSLHPNLVSSRGVHCIQQTINIRSPDRVAREKILQSILEVNNIVAKETLKILDFTAIAVKTEGYVARDLELLVNRTLHAKISTERYAYESKFQLTTEDFEETLSTFKPVSIRNVPLHKAGDLGWVDVGGLGSVRKALIETLKWPTKYPQLFGSCPLRLKSGILLYGAPGTGKTLLAGVVAKECGLNFISIKGPELLNKYIGASEQAVRDLFSKAQSAKPCVLFFDEFDSIAPKRGHDSTGVTDRVVNQLLTQLDGVEGLQGVYVLAATSRPDLIDPALLRPGRLDICLNCAMPDEEERWHILIALTRRMSLAVDVNLQDVAAVCENFTGADLKALLYNAQLKAIHEETDDDRNLNESVVWIKGDSSQYSSKRRASVIMDESGIYKFSLSKSVSASSSWDKSSGPEDLLSPKFKIDSPGSRTPKSAQTVKYESDIVGEDEFVKNNQGFKLDKINLHIEGAFHFPDCSDVTSEVRDVKQAPGDVPGTAGNDVSENVALSGEVTSEVGDVEQVSDNVPGPAVDGIPAVVVEDVVDGEISPSSTLPSECLQSSQPKTAPCVMPAQMTKDHLQNGLDSSKDSDNSDQHHLESVLTNLSDEGLKRLDTEAAGLKSASKNLASFSAEHGECIPCVDGIDGVNEQTNDGRNPASHFSYSLPHPKPGSLRHPTKYNKRRRGYDRGNRMNLDVNMATTEESKSPSVEKPVTVFTSLGRGLATLSAEDEAKYLAMVEEIQGWGGSLFEAGNAKQKASSQLESRPSVLIEVCQRHLLEAAKSMRPSVSASERERYIRIYDNFVTSRTAGFEKPHEAAVGKRATLA